MRVRERGAVQRPAREPRHKIVERAERDQRVPAERARVNVADRPLGEVAHDVDAADRHHRPFERREAVEREREHDELQRRIGAQLPPRVAHGHDAVDHRRPRRREQHEAHDHAEGLHPLRYRVVVQVMRARPRCSCRRTPRTRRSRGDSSRSVARPASAGSNRACPRNPPVSRKPTALWPYHHCTMASCAPGNSEYDLLERRRQREVVHDVQHRDDDDQRAVEPVRDVDRRDLAPRDRAEEHDRVADPDHGDRDVERPLELGVLLAAVPACEQRPCRRARS